ncbi:amino acid adenylation domain-containing protein [Desulfuromonas sp. KJ2020]|uniref:amino acid adenylation domain-containing protein n=1 Tax=Desulfuromonas sp. KJ2020 TaxID=2919173 RepID=UPI0020A701E5|nr:amino acid adenylation domain-containing protein [Desulfuromonas sp. KJ2020]MCP3178145.1 amino acid adenylation domain-containing protein [Desulfuromonas sp. KJ2020]
MKNCLLQHYLKDAALRWPEKTALTDGSKSISYRQLSASSTKVALCLQDLGVLRQDRVIIYQQRSIDTITAILGILKADAVYIPIDHKTPFERWVRIVRDAEPRLILCDEKTMPQAKAALECLGVAIPMMLMSDQEVPLSGAVPQCLNLVAEENTDRAEPPCANEEDDLAYVLYTSGSTGQPKGVMISHANVTTYVDWAVSKFNITEKDKILGTAPFHFDMSTFDIYCALKAGATLCVASELMTLFPEKLIQFIEQHQVTLWKGVASLLMYMARAGALRPDSMPTLTQVLFAGETLPTKYLIDWMTVFPEKTFYNAYGPTEATGVSLCYCVNEIPSGPEIRIPIGAPRENISVVLLSEDDGEVLPGEVGELCLAGKGLSRGYLNDPLKTDRAFKDNPLSPSTERIYKTGDLARKLPNGNFEYIGRKDRQLKYMGYRIEAGEIEQALLAIPQVKDTSVLLVGSKLDKGLSELTAFWEAEGEVDMVTIASELKKRLPAYMIPKRFVRVEKMPRCSRGKVDWSLLEKSYLGI